MIALPPPLAPWGPLFALLPADLAAALGPWLERLVLAVGPLRAARPRPGGEPDGFSGIERRGSYERLLLSEWLLADEVPDEFARRATTGEHAFHAIARRAPAAAATSVALFDAGPDQLGSPRIAHLAALIVLARRAEQAGARFAWGLLHDPEGALFPGVTAESALRLIGARQPLMTGDDELTAWSVRARKSGWEDIWIAGRRPTQRRADSAWAPAYLEAHDVLDPARRAVRVVVSRPPAPAREIDLDLPDERACARLLRDPFVTARPAPSRTGVVVSATSNAIFGAHGTKLLVRGQGGEIIAYPVPSSPTLPENARGRPKRYQPRSRGVVLAVGWLRGGLVLLIVGKGELRFERTTGKPIKDLERSISLPADLGFEEPTLDDAIGLLVFPYKSQLVALVLDARGKLYRVASAPSLSITRVASEVSALATLHDRISFVGRDVDPSVAVTGAQLEASSPVVRAWHLVAVDTSDRPGSLSSLEGEGTFEAVYGRVEDADEGSLAVAVRQGTAGWTILSTAGAVTLEAPSDARVVGVYRASGWSRPGLVVLESDQRVITVLGPGSRLSLPRASAPIARVAQATERATLAYVTVTGEIVIHALTHDNVLARYLPREGS